MAGVKTSSKTIVSMKMKLLLKKAIICLAVCGLVTPVWSAETTVSWTDIRDLGVEGRGWNETKAFYDRFPTKAEATVRPAVWSLSENSAGMLVRFVSDATEIRARWDLTSPKLAMPHMPATGVSGLDLYVKTPAGKWHWLAVGIPNAQSNSVTLVTGLPTGSREYILYLPLYNGVKLVEVGIPEKSTIAKAQPWGDGERKPIVFYGTSILQGGCASRPGMVHTAILGRRFNWPTLNFGFSGNGKMEIEIADLLAELNPAVYVLDCLPNMTSTQVKERVEPFVLRLRKAHPETPIVLVEDRTYSNAFLIPAKQKRQTEARAELTIAYDNLQKSGVKNLIYVKGDSLLGDDGEATVDGSHLTDLGFMRQAEQLEKVLNPLLQSK